MHWILSSEFYTFAFNAFHIMHYILCIVFYLLYSMHCILCIELYTFVFYVFLFMHFSPFIVFYALNSILYNVFYCTQCIILYALYSMQCILWIAFCALQFMHYNCYIALYAFDCIHFMKCIVWKYNLCIVLFESHYLHSFYASYYVPCILCTVLYPMYNIL